MTIARFEAWAFVGIGSSAFQTGSPRMLKRSWAPRPQPTRSFHYPSATPIKWKEQLEGFPCFPRLPSSQKSCLNRARSSIRLFIQTRRGDSERKRHIRPSTCAICSTMATFEKHICCRHATIDNSITRTRCGSMRQSMPPKYKGQP